MKFELTRKIILYSLPILALAGLTIPLMIGQSNLSVLGSYIAVPMFFAPIIYLKYSKNPIQSIDSGKPLFLLLLIFYFFCFSISIALLYLFEVRPFAYFIIITLMATLILLEIVLFEVSKSKSMIILLQIMILALNVIWGVTLNYYYYIGNADIFSHAWYIENLIANGYVTDVFAYYRYFPLWHIMVSSTYIILGVDFPLHKMIFFINGLIYSFILIIVYLISSKIFKNMKLALLSSLFVCFNVDFIFYGMYSISRSVVSFLEIMLILLLLDHTFRKMLLAIFLTIVIVLYHTVSIPFIMLILIAILSLQKYYGIEKNSRFLTLNYLKITIAFTLAYWMFNANVLFQILINSFIRPPAVGTLTKSIILTPFSELFNYFQYIPLLIFVIIGVLWVLQSRKFSEFAKIFCILSLLLIPVTFPGPGLLLNKLASNFNINRFGEYAFFFISITGAVGFAGVYFKIHNKLKFIIIILFFIMTFLSISNDFIASDNPLIKRPYYTSYLTNEETFAFRNIANFTNGYVMSDYVTTRYLEDSLFEFKSHFLEIERENMTFLRNSSIDSILVREHELEKRPLKLLSSYSGKFILRPGWTSPETDYYYYDLPLWSTLKVYNKIYDSGGVTGFV